MLPSKWFKTFRNMTEHIQPVKLSLKSGLVPPTLSGSYYKCGPGVFREYESSVMHPFDGDGVVSAFRFHGAGEVTYQSKIVDTEHRQAEQRQGQRLYSGAFGTPPILRALKNSANTNVLQWGSKLLVFCESGPPYVLDPASLDTIGILEPFQQGTPVKTAIPGLNAMLRRFHVFGDVVGAHPKVIGDVLVFYTLEYSHHNTTITFFEMDQELHIRKITPFTTKGFLYIHDFVVTESHYVFMQHALDLNVTNAHMGIVQCLRSRSNECGTAHAVSRAKNGRNHKATIAPGFITHHAGSCILASGLCMYSITFPELVDFNNMAKTRSSIIQTNWDFDGDLSQKIVFDTFVEFPVHSHDSLGVSTYATTGTENVQRCLVKFRNGQVESQWDAGPTAFIGEPVLDGNGHLVTVIHDIEQFSSILAVFDINHISAGPIAELWLPEHVPTTLHGSWHSR